VGPKVIIGNGVKVQNNISIYEGVEVEDDVFLGPSMVFTNVINPRAFIQRKDEFKKTLLKKGCSIGANATIVCGVTIGRYALVGAGAVVTKDVPDFALMTGVPAKQTGWVSRAGNRLPVLIAHHRAGSRAQSPPLVCKRRDTRPEAQFHRILQLEHARGRTALPGV
jgi:UDP-2-acetamido-3-amino-2,3-dideoxy-glucuronate N-acetyltransferase